MKLNYITGKQTFAACNIVTRACHRHTKPDDNFLCGFGDDTGQPTFVAPLAKLARHRTTKKYTREPTYVALLNKISATRGCISMRGGPSPNGLGFGLLPC